ncbi:MAG: tRNA-binding protein [Flavobacteriaceae bacterium]|jgi:tRNA-binding protein
MEFSTFEKIDFRVGTILSADPFPKANKPAFQLTIDFGPLGIKKSSAQITQRYTLEELPGKQVIAIVNVGTKKIADFESQCLILGASDGQGVILLTPESSLPNGQQIV